MDNAFDEMTENPHQPVEEQVASSNPWRPWLVPALVGIGVIILVVIALTRGETRFDPASPEGAVQEYLQAISERRWADALEVVDPQIAEGCRPNDLSMHVWDSFTASYEGTTQGPNTVYINVRLDYGDRGIWGGGGWSQSVQFALIEIDGLWYITDDPWPNFRDSCGRF